MAKEKKENKSIGTIPGLIIICFATWGFIHFFFNTGPSDGPAATGQQSTFSRDMDVWIMSQEMVKSKLKSPSTAKFPRFKKEFLRLDGDKRYTVSAYVDSQNSFGAMIRGYFVLTMKDNMPEKNTWTLEQFDWIE